MVDTYWSDHCRHTTFSTHLDQVDGGGPRRFRRPMTAYLCPPCRQVYGEEKAAEASPDSDGHRHPRAPRSSKKRGQLPELDESEEINACSIHVTATKVDGEEQDWLLMFKNETHNHPTEIEPFGGAATCIGGCIRDPLSGRAYVHQAMRVTGCGDPRTASQVRPCPASFPSGSSARLRRRATPPTATRSAWPPAMWRRSTTRAYVAKRLECGAVVAAAPAGNVRRERPAPGDVVILLGGRTGPGRHRRGHRLLQEPQHASPSPTMASEVQKGNAPEERKIQRLFRDGNVTRLIKRCNDFGAGGVSVAIGELADGLRIDLDAVRKKYDGLDGTELAISESQERMAVVVAPEDEAAFIAAAERGEPGGLPGGRGDGGAPDGDALAGPRPSWT